MFDQEDEYTSLMESYESKTRFRQEPNSNEDEMFDTQEFFDTLDTNDIPF